MIRTQVYLTEEQARDIKLRAKREDKHEAEVIRELLSNALNASRNTSHETTGEALLRLGSHVARDSLMSVRYSTELNSTTSSVIPQRTDRHEILGEKPSDFQC